MFYNSYQSASAALEKLSGVLEERPTVAEPTDPVPLPEPRGELRFDGVRFGYTGARAAAPGPDDPGRQTWRWSGPPAPASRRWPGWPRASTTRSDGEVRLDGVPLDRLADDDLRRARGDGDPGELPVLRDDRRQHRLRAARRHAGGDRGGRPGHRRARLHRALPEGYDTDVHRRGGRLSAGQRQLVSFARAFLADPAVLILDEATSSLDVPSERLVQHALQTLLADRTALIIAHRLSTVEIADRVLVMEDGRIVEDGTPAELVAGTGRFADLHRAWADSLV